MNRDELLKALDDVDNVLANVRNPALTRQDHFSIVQVMNFTKQRVNLSYKLDEKVKELEKELKELKEGKDNKETVT
jgi:hypothetical protein